MLADRILKSHTQVKRDRLVFSDFFPKQEHLDIKSLSDVFLDTPLYNAHSTASDMLWAQVLQWYREGETCKGGGEGRVGAW